jgi:cbb3-type cytochrome oxidase subunit 3
MTGNKYTLRLFSAFLAAFGLFFLNAAVSYAIGQMSEPINIESAVKGEAYNDQLILINTENQPVKLGFVAAGDIAPWTTFYMPDDLTKPVTQVSLSPKANQKIAVKFSIPSTQANGTYLGTITASTISEANNSQSKTVANVSFAIPRSVTITISGAQLKSATCQIIPENLKLKPNESLKTAIWCNNTGNVSIKPMTRIIVKQGNSVLSDVFYPFPDANDRIIPNSLQHWIVNWPSIGQKNGTFDLTIQVVIDDKVVTENKFLLTIDNSFTKLLSASLAAVFSNGSAKFIGAAIGVLLFVAVIFFIYSRRTRKINNSKVEFSE